MTATTFARPLIKDLPQTTSTAQLIWVWIQISSIAGILGSLAYLLSTMELFGATTNYVLKISFGPLIAIAYLGYFAFFHMNRATSVLYLATMLGILAGIIVNTMLLIDGIQSFLLSSEIPEIMSAAWYASNTVQLGLDISRDFYLALATLLLGMVLWSHPRFHKIFAFVTSVIGLAILLVNLWPFSVPPIEAGVVDLGSLVGGWYLLISLRVLGSRKWLENQLSLKRIHFESRHSVPPNETRRLQILAIAKADLPHLELHL